MLVKQVEGCQTQLSKFYSCTNRILCAVATRKIKEQIDRATFVGPKKGSKMSIADTKSEELMREPRPEDGEVKIYPAIETNRQAYSVAADSGVGVSERLNSKDPEPKINEPATLSKTSTGQSFHSDTEYFDESVNMQWRSLVWPSSDTIVWKFVYAVMFPISAALYVTIPNPRIPHGDQFNMLPLIYIICILWMGGLSYFITWWLVSLSIAFNISFLILPLILLPAGLMLRDFPHWLDFRRKIKSLRKRLHRETELKEKVYLLETTGKSGKQVDDLKAMLADYALKPRKEVILEHYAGPIFSFTIGSSATWLVYNIIHGEIPLYSKGTSIQILLLMAVIIFKLIFITRAKFRTPRNLFYIHIAIYVVYFALVVGVEYIYN